MQYFSSSLLSFLLWWKSEVILDSYEFYCCCYLFFLYCQGRRFQIKIWGIFCSYTNIFHHLSFTLRGLHESYWFCLFYLANALFLSWSHLFNLYWDFYLPSSVNILWNRCPERYKPGTFDICGHSHQIWHIFVVITMIFMYLSAIASF